MLGAIMGDTVGSVYEFNNIKTTQFPFLPEEAIYTDDSVMSMAVAQWLVADPNHATDTLVDSMVRFAHDYPCPKGGYGGGFSRWLFGGGERKPYHSWGNGSAMRVSAVGWMFDSLEETERVAEISATVTHDHPEGIKGAQATAAAIFLARTGHAKEEIREYVTSRYGYDLSRSCDEIRPDYYFNESCQGTVPQAFAAFFESTDYERCIRLGVSLGGDSDTLCCIAGGIAEAFYGKIPAEYLAELWKRLPEDFRKLLRTFGEHSFYRLPEGL